MTGCHLAPGDTPERETALEHGELITSIELTRSALAARSHYLKVRDRASYEFALASAAVPPGSKDGVISAARPALRGVATKPWRAREAEKALFGHNATEATLSDLPARDQMRPLQAAPPQPGGLRADPGGGSSPHGSARG